MKVVSRTCFGFTLPRLGYASEERGREKRDGNPKKKAQVTPFPALPDADARRARSPVVFFLFFFHQKPPTSH